MPIIHSAGEIEGPIQKCSRCGAVLQDYTNALSVGDWRPVWWSGNVIVGQGFAGTTNEPANCQAVEHHVQRTAEWVCGSCEHHNYDHAPYCQNCGSRR